MEDPTKRLPLDIRYFPTYLALVVLGMILLLFRDLSDDLRHYLTPSLVVYCLGSSLVSHLHVTLGNRTGDRVKISTRKHIVIMLTHLTWLGLFIGYNCYYFLCCAGAP